jgi:hypothetical protein
MSQPDLFRMPRKPWNAGRMTGAKAPLKPKHIWAIRQHLKSLGSVRDLAMFNTALDAKLRGCDLRGRRPDDWLFPSRSNAGGHIGTRQYARLVDGWVRMIDLNPSAYGTHSLRRTKVALIYKKTGNLRACQLAPGARQAGEHRQIPRHRGR